MRTVNEVEKLKFLVSLEPNKLNASSQYKWSVCLMEGQRTKTQKGNMSKKIRLINTNIILLVIYLSFLKGTS